MTRRCCVCKKILGEKCPECGVRAIPCRRKPDWFHCSNLGCPRAIPNGVGFRKGQGGTTHGYCRAHLRQSIREALNSPRAERARP